MPPHTYTRYVTRTATYLGATDFQPLAPDFNIEIGYLYHSSAMIRDEDSDDREHGDPADNGARPGARAPHVWVQHKGQRLSTLDLFGRGFVLLTTPEGNAWRAAAGAVVQTNPGSVIDCYRVGVDLQEQQSANRTFRDAYALRPAGAVLVRPDGFVGWRTQPMPDHADSALRQALDRLLLRPPAPAGG